MTSTEPGAPLVITEPRARNVGLAGMAGTLLAVAIGVTPTSPVVGGILVVVFGGTFLAATALVIRPGQIVVDRAGLLVRSVWRHERLPWDAIDRFVPIELRRAKTVTGQLVGIAFREGTDPTLRRRYRMRRLQRMRTGADGVLPSTSAYGWEAKLLVDVLEGRRRDAQDPRFGGPPRPEDP
ncbi:MAG: hypothetical protein JJT89_03875 [Nitriliruptoraceae bacterium]|nr:hypothetical protein [Nitriliruptoraceae bacterium]